MSAPDSRDSDARENRARANVVHVDVDVVRMSEVVDIVMGWSRGTRVRSAIGVNAYVCNMATTNRRFRADVAAADLAYADGQSIVWAARSLGHDLPERIATTDLIEPLAAAAADQHVKLFFFGAAPGIAQLAADRLAAANAGLEIETHDGFVTPDAMPALVAQINASGAGILLVGLGDPLQQRWVAEHRDELTVPAILTCGGLFDWISGSHRRAPAWMIRAGLEWLWRFMIEPRRLARRYLLGNPAFIARVTRQRLFSRRSNGRS